VQLEKIDSLLRYRRLHGLCHTRSFYQSCPDLKMAELVREPQPRWDAKKMAAMQKQLFGK